MISCFAMTATPDKRFDAEALRWQEHLCEAALRLTLSYVIAPAADDRESCLRIAQMVRSLLARPAGQAGSRTR